MLAYPPGVVVLHVLTVRVDCIRPVADQRFSVRVERDLPRPSQGAIHLCRRSRSLNLIACDVLDDLHCMRHVQ